MTAIAPAVNLELVSRMPWLLPEPESIWSITGTYGRGRGTFHNYLAMVAPYDTSSGHAVFTLIDPELHTTLDCPTRYIAPNQIFRAYRLVLVHANRSRLAYYLDEQDLIDRGQEDR